MLLIADASPAVRAQGVIEQRKCPHADGNAGGKNDRFTYASWVDKERDGSNFRRCIENQAAKQIWTDWKGLLSNGWIPMGHRMYGTTSITGGQVAPSKTDLCWGDGRGKRIDPEAKCYKGRRSLRRRKADRLLSSLRLCAPRTRNQRQRAR